MGIKTCNCTSNNRAVNIGRGMKIIIFSLASAFLINFSPVAVHADDTVKSLVVNLTHSERWNLFADRLLKLHKKIINENNVRVAEKLGGYHNRPDFFKDVQYIDRKTNRLLSRVLWETRNPELVHSMEIYYYDKQGRVIRDYGVSYLTSGRAAPMLTMINFHSYKGGLHAFRQFDASNNRELERCEGKDNGKNVDIVLDGSDILEFEDLPKSIMTSRQYKKCFSGLPKTAGKYLTPQ